MDAGDEDERAKELMEILAKKSSGDFLIKN